MKTKKLIWQLYPTYLLIAFFVLVSVTWYATNAMRGFFLEQSAADLEERARLLIPHIREHLDPLDAAALDGLCKEVARFAETRVTVILPSGRVVGDSREDPAEMDNHIKRPEVAAAVEEIPGTAIRYSRTLERDMMYVAVPLTRGDDFQGILRTAVNIRSIEERLDTLWSRFVLWCGVVAVLTAFISFWVSRRIARPLVEMKRGTTHFASGNLAHRLVVPKNEEMAGLATAMNAMAAQLGDRIRTVIRQRNELDAVLSSMQEGIVAVDLDERVININPAAARMFRRPPEGLVGRSVQEIVRNPPLHRFLKKALLGGETRAEDIVLYGADNGERTLHIRDYPLRDAHGEEMGVLMVLEDVTRLRELENLRRDFAANVSHEIKTPLTAIKGFVETLTAGALERPEAARRFLRIIENHVDRLSAMIDDLMDLSRIEQQQTEEIHFEQGRIRDVLEIAVQVCRPVAGEKEITVSVTCEPDLSARINRRLLEQAAVNLLNNAIKYSGRGRAVRITARGNDDGISIAFEDQGIGIPAIHIPRLFERFYRVDKARSRKQGGTGLGLAIVKHIVVSHGGRVTVESRPGQGSTFTIHLPIR